MTTPRNVTPHGRIIEAARGKTSARAAAKAADISEGRWRQIVTGVQKAGNGITVPVNPRDTTLIAMATAVGADVEAVLRAAGYAPDEISSAMQEVDAQPSGIKDYSDDDLLKEVKRRITGRTSESDAHIAAANKQAGASPAARVIQSESQVIDPHPSGPTQPRERDPQRKRRGGS